MMCDGFLRRRFAEMSPVSNKRIEQMGLYVKVLSTLDPLPLSLRYKADLKGCQFRFL